MKMPRNAPGALEIEFLSSPLRPPRAGWLLLAAGLAVAAAAAMHLTFQVNELAAQRAALAALRSQEGGSLGSSAPAIKDPLVAQAIVARLGADWGGLLATLAQGLEPTVKILEVHGDAEHGTVRIVGEAPSLEAAFSYVERLQGRPGLRTFALDNHAWPQGANVGSVTFTASGTWGAVP